MNLLCCFAPGQPRLELLKNLVLTGVACRDKEFFDSLAALDARLAQGGPHASHQVVVIAPGPDERWESLLANRSPEACQELIVILPTDNGRLPNHPQVSGNLMLVSDQVHPLLLISYLASLVALHSGQGRKALVPPGDTPISSAM